MSKEKIIVNPLGEALASCRLVFKYSVVLGGVINLLMLASPLYSMQVLDRVLSSRNLNTLTMLTLIVALTLGLLSIIQGSRSFAMTRMSDWLEGKLSGLVFANSIRMSLQSKVNIGSQKLRDLQVIKSFLTSPSFVAMLDTPWAVIFVIATFLLHRYLGYLTLFGGVVLICLGIYTDRTTKKLIEQNNEDSIKNNAGVDQATRNAEVIHVMGFMNNVVDMWQGLNSKVHSTQIIINKRQAVLGEITKFVRTALQTCVMAMGAYLVVHDEMSSGGIIASSTLVGRALVPFEQFISAWKGYINYRKSYERLNKAFDLMNEDSDRMILPEPEGNIEVQGVFFAPANTNKYTLRSVSFDLNAGELLVVIGPSGSGKTTLAKIVAGAWLPSSGAVRIDGANIKDWDRQQLGGSFGYLPQDIELFSGSIKQNIGRMQADADPEKVIEAAQLAGVHEMILNLPNGYDTEIGTEGSGLSGGQKQRVALARALYGSPKILVLDEPNSNLDSKGEEALIMALEVAKERKITTIVISHRPNIMNYADKILIMQDGVVVNFGTKDSILKDMNKVIANK
jgi:PrtD family type I secretion system ABC transporter